MPRRIRRNRWAVLLAGAVILALANFPAGPGRWATAGEDGPSGLGRTAAGTSVRGLLESGAAPVTIVCLGDSVTGVYYHTGGQRAHPEMLEIAIQLALPRARARVVNAGISGHTTVEGLARLDRDVLGCSPALVTISFGLNDVARVPEERFAANLESLVARCRAAGAEAVLCTPNTVLTTPGRPLDTVRRYAEVIRRVGRGLGVAVCDQFQAGESFRAEDAWAWRLTMSDEIHPNMDGHKRMAEALCRTITGRSVSLASVPPPRDFLARTRAALVEGRPVKVIAMPPTDGWIAAGLRRLDPRARVEVHAWPVQGRSLATLEREAKDLVRAAKPDLVVLAVPGDAAAPDDDQFVRSYSWVMNWSLSFGHQEWDCIVVHPRVIAAEGDTARDALVRQLVAAQDLTLIDRAAGERTAGAELFERALVQAAH